MLYLNIVIPCFNEEKRLDLDAFSVFTHQHPQVHLVFVDDGSTDSTNQKLHAFCKKHVRCQLVDSTKNAGKASAVHLGMHWAFKKKPSKYYSFLDADLSISLEQHYALCNNLEKNDLSLCYHTKRKGKQSIRNSIFRNLISKALFMLNSKLLKLNIADTQCGSKVFSSDLAQFIFKEPFLSSWLFDIEIFLKIKAHFGLSFLNTQTRGVFLQKIKDHHNTKLHLSSMFKLGKDYLSIYYHYFLK